MESAADQIMYFFNTDKKQNANSKETKSEIENFVRVTADGGNDDNRICKIMKSIIDSGNIGCKEYSELVEIHSIFCSDGEQKSNNTGN